MNGTFGVSTVQYNEETIRAIYVIWKINGYGTIAYFNEQPLNPPIDSWSLGDILNKMQRVDAGEKNVWPTGEAWVLAAKKDWENDPRNPGAINTPIGTCEFKNDLKENVFCRIARSEIHGVGVVAIRTIPAGINPMKEKRRFDFNLIDTDEIMDDPTLPDSLKRLVLDMCPQDDDILYVPPFSMNEIGVSYYLNHSTTPNMRCDDDGNFYTMREIKEGEELTVDYGTYGALNLEK